MRKEPIKLTHRRLLEVLDYSPLTGFFHWRQTLSPKATVGSRAGALTSDGYRKISIDKEVFAAHRLAWFYVHGQWPNGQIDHRYRDRDDNRISELRDVSSLTNNQNRRVAAISNSCGLLGVTTLPARERKFAAKLYVGNRCVLFARFDTPEEAHQAYLAAKRIHHPGSTL